MKIRMRVEGKDRELDIQEARLTVLYVDRESMEVTKLPSGEWRVLVTGKMLENGDFKVVDSAE